MGSIPSGPIIIGITVTIIFHHFYLVLWQGPGICLFFRYLWLSLCGVKIHKTAIFFSLLIITRSSNMVDIGGSVWISKWEFYADSAWCKYCVSLMKFQCLAQFWLDHFSYPITPVLELCLSQFATFNYYYYWLFREFFFIPVLANDFSLEAEWQQVFSSLQDSSQYAGRSQLCCSLDDLHLSSCFQVLQSLYQSFGECTKCPNYNWYHRHFHVPKFFQFSTKVLLVSLFLLSFSFTLW